MAKKIGVMGKWVSGKAGSREYCVCNLWFVIWDFFQMSKTSLKSFINGADAPEVLVLNFEFWSFEFVSDFIIHHLYNALLNPGCHKKITAAS